MRRAMLLSILAFAPLAGLVLRFHWIGLPGVWTALGCWLACRAVLLWRHWADADAGAAGSRLPGSGLPGSGLPGSGLPGSGLPGSGLSGSPLPVSPVGGQPGLDGQGQGG
jgi:hypothetical protein